MTGEDRGEDDFDALWSIATFTMVVLNLIARCDLLFVLSTYTDVVGTSTTVCKRKNPKKTGWMIGSTSTW